MNQQLYPCLWFDNHASQAASFYLELLGGTLVSQNPVVSQVDIRSTRLMFLNGGPMYPQNPAFSLFLYCGSDAEIERVYTALTDGGSILMPLDKYDWSRRYAWVQDKFGVSWQLDVDPIRCEQKIVPSILFMGEHQHQVRKAMLAYTELLPDSRILLEAPFPPDSGQPDGSLLFAQFRIHGLVVNAMCSVIPHAFSLSPAGSLVISCDTQEEIDRYWEILGSGGQYQPCGWLTDRFGLSWQVVPAQLGAWLQEPERGPRVMQALLKMSKLNMHQLATLS